MSKNKIIEAIIIAKPQLLLLAMVLRCCLIAESGGCEPMLVQLAVNQSASVHIKDQTGQ